MDARKLLIMVCLLASSAIPAGAQTLLPGTFSGWTASAAPSQVSANQAEQFASDKAAILREYGLTSAEHGAYSQAKDSVTVTLYRMVDPSAAYGAFTYLRDPAMTALGPEVATPYSAAEHDRALLVVGNLVLDITSAKARPVDSDLKTLANSLARRADHRPFPDIAEFLPASGLISNSERYVLGPRALAGAFPSDSTGSSDWIGFNDSAEAIVARYHLTGQSKSQDAILLVALYPTQQVAADIYGRLDKWFALNVEPSQANGRPVVFGTRTGSLVAVLSGVDSQAAAATLLGQIHYGSQVTWNEPSQSFSDPPITTMVVGAIMGTGAIMLLAIVAGVGFGGFRLLMKFLLPGRVFDRNEQVEILQLGLTSKPVNAKDFYS